MMSEYNRKYVDVSNYDTRKTFFMSVKDRSSSRFQNGGNSEDYEIRNILNELIFKLLDKNIRVHKQKILHTNFHMMQNKSLSEFYIILTIR